MTPRRFPALPSVLVRASVSLAASGAALGWLATVPAGAQPRFTPEVALDVRTPAIAAMTDDGARVAVTVRSRRDRLNVDHQRFGDPTYISPVATRLLVIDTGTGDRAWLHEDPVPLRGAAWSPDGGRLAWFAVLEGRYRLRLFDVARGEDRTLPLRTDREIASSSPLVWSPDGASVLLGLRPDGWAEEARAAFHALTDADVIVQDSRNDFLAWDRVRNLADRMETVLVSVADGSVREVLSAATPVDPDFSEDGSALTYSTATRTRTSYTRRDGTEYELFRLDLAPGSEPVSLHNTGEERLEVVWNESRDAFAYADEGAVFVRRANEDEAVDVTANHRGDADEPDCPPDADAEAGGANGAICFEVERWSPSGGQLLLSSQRAWLLLDLASDDMRTVLELEEDEDERPRREIQGWSADGRRLYFSTSARDRWRRGLERLDTASGDIETLILDDRLYRSWQVSDDGSTLVFARSDGDHPDEIWTARGDGSGARRLTNSNPQLDGVALTRSELVEYLDVDGNTLYGILYYPVGYEAGRVYPMVAEIYEEFFDNGFNENMNLITARGWFGFRPSVRFEEGFPGEAWLKAVPNGINKVIERGLVAADRVGVYGQSYGGYATNLLITQTDRFAAAANVSGKVNIISFLGDSPKITTRNYAAAEVGQDRIGATLWEQPHKYIAHSAVLFADRIETPLLMLSGEGDWNVPATNQREMYYALRRLEKEVVWVHYTAGGHGAGRASTEADFLDHWRRMFDWFAEHFGEEPQD